MIKSFLKYHVKDRLVLAHQTRALKHNAQPPILVFTMAKVGSLSVYHSLKKSGLESVFHIHSLNEQEVQASIDFCAEHGIYPDSRSPVFLLNKALKNNKRKFKIISLFRNPIERNISAFFDAFKIYMGVTPTNYGGDMQALVKAFHQKVNHSYAVNWYDTHFLEGTGLDVYQTPFNTEKKYTVLENNRVEVILIDSQMDDSKKERLIADFLGLSHFALQNVNLTSQAKHAQLYSNFKAHIRFDKTYINQQLDSKYFNHFFTEEDKKGLIERWGKGNF